jgi:non-homologous end joining protein Ku
MLVTVTALALVAFAGSSPASNGPHAAQHALWLAAGALILMPVALFAAATEERISFNQLHKYHGRIKQQIFCDACNAVVPKTDLLRGYRRNQSNLI